MERVQRTVEIKLTPEECEILWKAEQLLREMEKEISGITTPVYQSDKEEIAECLRVFGKITSRYDVHLTLGVDGERDDSENSLNYAGKPNMYGEEHPTAREIKRTFTRNRRRVEHLSCHIYVWYYTMY